MVAESDNVEPSLLERIVERTISKAKDSGLFTDEQLEALREIMEKGSGSEAQEIAEVIKQEPASDN